MAILPYFQKWMPILWFRSNFSWAAWEGECALSQRVVAEMLGWAPFWRPGGRVHGLWSHQVAWHFIGFVMLFFDFHGALPSFLTRLTNGTQVVTSSCPLGFVSCSFPVPPENHCPPVFLTSCQANDLCFLPLFWMPAWLPAYKPFPAQVAYNPWWLPVVWCLALGPRFLTSRCDSLCVPNVTI